MMVMMPARFGGPAVACEWYLITSSATRRGEAAGAENGKKNACKYHDHAVSYMSLSMTKVTYLNIETCL